MRLSRSSRIIGALVALLCVLFSQVAVAAYACPGMRVGEAIEGMLPSTAEVEQHGMPDCDEMDSSQPALCHAHMQSGDQSLDRPVSPSVHPALAVSLVPVIGLLQSVSAPSFVTSADPEGLRRSSSTPLSILNCCFRI